MNSQKAAQSSIFTGSIASGTTKTYEKIHRQPAQHSDFAQFHKAIFDFLKDEDSAVYELIEQEHNRQTHSIQLIAAENQCSRAVLAALGSVVQDKTTEGFAGARFHGGCEVVDQMEQLAIDRAKQAFNARYANVQPHSGTQANQIVMAAVLEPGDKILSQGMDQGGHVSHGSDVSMGGRVFNVQQYCVKNGKFTLDYDQIHRQALEFRPKMIICGASAYARQIDFKRFREIADEVGAYLLADISHIAGLIIAGAHQSPINYAHFTTTSTYKPGGPRGGLIIMGHDFDTLANAWGTQRQLWQHLQKATFPGVQGTPYLNHIAAKAVFFREAVSEEFISRQHRIIANAKRLSDNFIRMGYDVLTGGTDNHMVLINIANSRPGMTGFIAQHSLEQCGIVVNMNKLPYDSKPAAVTSGMRLGTPIVTKQGMAQAEMDLISELIDRVIMGVSVTGDKQFQIEEDLRSATLYQVSSICERFIRT